MDRRVAAARDRAGESPARFDDDDEQERERVDRWPETTVVVCRREGRCVKKTGIIFKYITIINVRNV